MFWMHNQNFIYTFDIVLKMLDNLYFISNVFESYCKQLPYRNHKVSLTIKKRHVISSWWQAIFTPVISTYIKREKKYNPTCNPIHLDIYNWAFTYSKTYLSQRPIYVLCVFAYTGTSFFYPKVSHVDTCGTLRRNIYKPAARFAI